MHLMHWMPSPRYSAFLQCTAPFLAAEDVDGVVGAVIAGADAALTVTESHGFLWTRGKDGAAGVNHDLRYRPRRQDREPEFLETGAAYAMRTDGFRASKHRFFGQVALVEMPRDRVIEIDEPADLVVADAMAAAVDPHRTSPLPERVAAIVMDFDGVLTDNLVLTNEEGVEAVVASRGDGLGIDLLREKVGIPMVVISKERNKVVLARCEKLGIGCIHGVDEKLSVLTAWCDERMVDLADVVYVGNDVNDITCLRAAGCGVVVADAHPEARAAADMVLSTPGGRGAIRELADLLLAANATPAGTSQAATGSETA